MSSLAEDVDVSYNIVKNDFSIEFLKNTLSKEIARLVISQKYTINILDRIIEDLKRSHGGSDNG